MVADGFAALHDKFDKSLAKFTQSVVAALPSGGPRPDPKPILDAIHGAIERLGRQTATPLNAPPSSATNSAERIESDLIAFVERLGGEGRGARFNELIAYLLPRHPD